MKHFVLQATSATILVHMRFGHKESDPEANIILQTENFNNFGQNLSQSATRLTRMAASGNRVAIFKLAGIISLAVIVLWFIKRLVFG